MRITNALLGLACMFVVCLTGGALNPLPRESQEQH